MPLFAVFCQCVYSGLRNGETELEIWFHIKWVSFFILCAKLENPKSQLWVCSKDRKCLLEILDLLLYPGPTNDGALSPGTALRSCSAFRWTACASELKADVLRRERTAMAPLPYFSASSTGNRIFMPGGCIWVWTLNTSSDTCGALSSTLKESNSWQSGGLHLNSIPKTPYIHRYSWDIALSKPLEIV